VGKLGAMLMLTVNGLPLRQHNRTASRKAGIEHLCWGGFRASRRVNVIASARPQVSPSSPALASTKAIALPAALVGIGADLVLAFGFGVVVVE